MKIAAGLVGAVLYGTAMLAACGGDTEQSPSRNASSGTSEGTSAAIDPDPDHRRVCEDGDFVCDNWSCQNTLEVYECYQHCTPNSEELVGAIDSECTEPERPFCAQVGYSDGGDYYCNGCAHVCVAEQGLSECGGLRVCPW